MNTRKKDNMFESSFKKNTFIGNVSYFKWRILLNSLGLSCAKLISSWTKLWHPSLANLSGNFLSSQILNSLMSVEPILLPLDAVDYVGAVTVDPGAGAA